MASPSAPVHPARYLAVFLAMLIGVYLLVFLTGTKHAEPKLGIDLQGGTRVTLTARTPDGSAPTRDALNQAQQIISARVNGLGVSGSEVIIDGNNLVITVPGSGGNEARALGQTARLYIRPVITAVPAKPGPPGASTQPAAPPAQPRPYPQEPAPTPTTTASAPEGPASKAPAGDTGAGTPTAPGSARLTPEQGLAARIALAKKLRQNADQRIQGIALQYQAARCSEDDVLAGNDDPDLPLVACSQDRQTAYLLAPSIISGDQIQNATSGVNQRTGQNIVNVQFKSAAASIWADFTAAHVGTVTAFTLDSKVVSAPRIEGAIRGGWTEIHGNFSAGSAGQLANVLKYGSLPLSFESSESETVSATLGLRSLRAGLIAGAIGLLLVLVYSLLYYRVLGILTALSLVATGAMVFAILVLLGRYINYTLDLAGIAGLIIGIGTTADSFVVYFERIKDEIREGRSFRSAVPRGWARARKTIVSGNAVTFLAAAVLYVLAVGQVKGFAFTLGLTTILDLVVVFLVTWPLVYLASKSPRMAKPAYNGLGAVQQVARERRAAHATVSTGRG
ncbi:MAG TPA: protein translocase subunit SecD [Mycobacterium sp.]|nr:protein translocase subunit SecD [Mycobacterium sp.]